MNRDLFETIADEEFATIKDHAALNATVTIAVVILLLWLALRRFYQPH